MSQKKEILSVEALVKTARVLTPKNKEILAGNWEKVAAIHTKDAEALRLAHKQEESDRLSEMASTYLNAASLIKAS